MLRINLLPIKEDSPSQSDGGNPAAQARSVSRLKRRFGEGKRMCAKALIERDRSWRQLWGYTFQSWYNVLYRTMIVRPGKTQYAAYKGRGITVAREWLSFQRFLNDMGARPDGLSIDRINVNGNYCADNCRWADHLQQCTNTRTTVYVKYAGVRLPLTVLARNEGLSIKVLRSSLQSACTIEQAVEEARQYAAKQLEGKRKAERYHASLQSKKTARIRVLRSTAAPFVSRR